MKILRESIGKRSLATSSDTAQMKAILDKCANEGGDQVVASEIGPHWKDVVGLNRDKVMDKSLYVDDYNMMTVWDAWCISKKLGKAATDIEFLQYAPDGEMIICKLKTGEYYCVVNPENSYATWQSFKIAKDFSWFDDLLNPVEESASKKLREADESATSGKCGDNLTWKEE